MDNTTVTHTDEQLFAQLQAGRYELLDTLYADHRTAFLRFATQQLFATEEDAADCFQDAVIIFYKNITSRKLVEMTCSIRTYLFAVGKRLVYKRNNQRRRESPVDLDVERNPSDEIDLGIYQRIEDDHRRQTLRAAVGQLGEICQQVLTLSFYHGYSIEAIQHALNFSSPGAVRIKKMRCLDALKKFIPR